MMLLALQSLERSWDVNFLCRRLRVPVCDVSLMHESETLIQKVLELVGDDNI